MKVRADRRAGALLAGVLLATFVALGATVALPAIDPSLEVEDVELSEDAQRGYEIYRREGLWRCDPAYARETAVDGEGATRPEDVAGQNPVMLGIERAGRAGDLGATCGSPRLSDDDKAAVDAFLESRAGGRDG